MKKWFRIALFFAFCVGILYAAELISDRVTLKNELVRLHVVAASDSDHDQNVKLQVRDVVLEAVEQMLEGVTDAREACAYIEDHLEDISAVANAALEQLGESARAVVSFLQEEFPVREYDTFSLPSGVYQSLRIVIGEGEGHNWWCVVFPNLCLNATSASVQTGAAQAGFSDSLSSTITGQSGYTIRFYLLDLVGQIENFFHKG